MAVNIDTVYQKVLAIANKEQRGYITPQEFNLFADHAQLDIFEQYFYDINQFGRLKGNSTEYSDMITILEEKIAIFKNIKLLYYQSPYYQKPHKHQHHHGKRLYQYSERSSVQIIYEQPGKHRLIRFPV